ncbi:MAG: DegT/DnrJ/EryC1/StrS family aminotransferase [Lachnospiraceae bacterium]|nr:DegT/DnrJ/EryC1/StrS family aminotransferase [Lachnospiraceae bacterium]
MEKILVTRSSMPTLSEYMEEISDIWDSRWMTNMGYHYKKLTEELEEYLKTENLTLLVNGHAALELSIQALGLKGEVITTPFTFASTTHAIVRNGLEPVFCDINADDYTIDVTKIEKLITDKTTAILPVHVYGNICDIEAISDVAKKYGLKVIYDAAHSFGESYKGKGIAEYGDVSIFSFHATKVFNTIEGGAAAYKDANIGAELRKLMNFGIKDEERIDGVGCNAKMNEFSAAMGVCNLRHVSVEIDKRKKVVERYLERLSGIKGLKLPNYSRIENPNYGYFPVVIDERYFGKNRNKVFDDLKNKNIYTRKYFYPLTNTFECFRGKYNSKSTPVAEQISQRVICLPMYADLNEADIDRVANALLEGR